MSWIKSFQMVLFALLIVAERCTNACAQGKLPELIREPIKNDDQPLLEQRMITFLDMLNRFPKKYCVKSTYSRLAVFDEDSSRSLFPKQVSGVHVVVVDELRKQWRAIQLYEEDGRVDNYEAYYDGSVIFERPGGQNYWAPCQPYGGIVRTVGYVNPKNFYELRVNTIHETVLPPRFFTVDLDCFASKSSREIASGLFASKNGKGSNLNLEVTFDSRALPRKICFNPAVIGDFSIEKLRKKFQEFPEHLIYPFVTELEWEKVKSAEVDSDIYAIHKCRSEGKFGAFQEFKAENLWLFSPDVVDKFLIDPRKENNAPSLKEIRFVENGGK